ncbi:MAG TPA: hypothetical protein PKA41_10205 [Verrucomicrobiota bacterium]|nr:hypothetical protein [Verrucomicrobiota bacterium]
MNRQHFFTTQDRIERLQSEVQRWIGTPFFESCGRRAKPGVAADCVSWIAAVLQRIGAIGHVPWPRSYVSRGGGAHMLLVMVSVLDNIERLGLVWTRDTGHQLPPLIPGDLLVYSTGTRLHHLAILVDAKVTAHSWAGEVRLASLDDHLEKLLIRLYRPLA